MARRILQCRTQRDDRHDQGVDLCQEYRGGHEGQARDDARAHRLKVGLRYRAQSGSYQEVDARRALADVRARPLPDEGDRTYSRPDAPHDGRRND